MGSALCVFRKWCSPARHTHSNFGPVQLHLDQVHRRECLHVGSSESRCGSACKWLCNPTLIESAACDNAAITSWRLHGSAFQLFAGGREETPAVPRGPPAASREIFSNDAFSDWLPPLSSRAARKKRTWGCKSSLPGRWLAGRSRSDSSAPSKHPPLVCACA